MCAGWWLFFLEYAISPSLDEDELMDKKPAKNDGALLAMTPSGRFGYFV